MTNQSDSNFMHYLILGRQTVYEQFDKAILTLSSGGLALSLAFLRDIVKFSETNNFTCLIASWIMFALAILSTVASFITSKLAFDYQIEIERKKKKPPNRYSKITKYINWISGTAFMSAVITTIIFVFQTLPKEPA